MIFLPLKALLLNGQNYWILQKTLQLKRIAIGDDGSIYIVGYSEDDLDGKTNNGGADAFLIKLDSEGNKKWTNLFGTSSMDIGTGLSIGSDGAIYMSGYTDGNLDGIKNSGYVDAFISKFDSSGSKEWTRLLGSSSYDYAENLAIGDDGSIYITGETAGSLESQHGNGDYDGFLTKFDSEGNRKWTRLFGTSSMDIGYGLSIGSDGAIYIAGYTDGNLDGIKNSGYTDAFISKFDSSGSNEWTRLLGSESDDYAYGVIIGNDDSVYITGDTNGDLDGQINNGEFDVFISKFDNTGSKKWTRLLGTSKNDNSFGGITIGDEDSIYISGETGGNLDGQVNSGEIDVFISKFDSKGNKNWTELLGSSKEDFSFGMDLESEGTIYITGQTSGDINGETNNDEPYPL